MLNPGHAWKYGDDINTDVILPGRYLNIADPKELAKHAMEDLDSGFLGKVKQDDYLIGGKNFGTGSSREHAPIALKEAGIACVIAESFARIFYRNGFNIGLPLFECKEAVEKISDGDIIQVDLQKGTIYNQTKNEVYQANPLSDFMIKLVDAGGLVKYVNQSK